jgi:hypothetical protein
MNSVNSPKKLTELSRLIGGINEQSTIFSAQKSSDLGTIRNVASQLKHAKRPDDIMLGKQYDECLLIAYGEPIPSLDVEALLNKINETAEQLHAACRILLNASPEIAISNLICKDILLK